jgi:hypothetical protein
LGVEIIAKVFSFIAGWSLSMKWKKRCESVDLIFSLLTSFFFFLRSSIEELKEHDEDLHLFLGFFIFIIKIYFKNKII